MHVQWFRWWWLLGLLGIGIGFIGCAEDVDDDDDAARVLQSLRLSAAQEVGTVVSSARGEGAVVINAERSALEVTLSTSGLQNVTQAHIHVGGVGVNGPVIFDLYTGEGPFPAVLTRTLTAQDLQSRPTEGIPTFAEALAALQAGRAYFNVHTTAYPGGEIRGQIGPQQFTAALLGANEIPPVVTGATGSATATLTAAQTELTVTLSTQGLQNVTAAHLRIGTLGEEGPIIFPLAFTAGVFPATLTVQLDSADVQPAPAQGIVTFADAVDALLTDRVYANVSTQAHADGEIRGHLLPFQ